MEFCPDRRAEGTCDHLPQGLWPRLSRLNRLPENARSYRGIAQRSIAAPKSVTPSRAVGHSSVFHPACEAVPLSKPLMRRVLVQAGL